jgi:putative endonuclease
MYYVYILQSQADQSFYTGFTTLQPNERIKKHNDGQVTYTAKIKPWKLIWHCAFIQKEKAIAFEKYLKVGLRFCFCP